MPLYEDFKRSPFWEAFYTNPGKFIFETEISFILLHYHQVKKALEERASNLICDFSFQLDLAYAKMGLSGTQLSAFESVLKEIKKELQEPDLYVYLECDAKIQLDRIRGRQRSEEASITFEFLESLNNALKYEVSLIDKKKLIIINSVENDFAHVKSVQNEMVKLINDAISTRCK